jgi:WD40 repeat protein
MLKVEIAQEFVGHHDSIYTLHVLAEGSAFYSAGADRILTQWYLGDNSLSTAVVTANSPIYSIAVHGNLLVIGLSDGGIYFIDKAEKKLIKSIVVHSKGIFDLKWLIPGELIIAGSGDGSFSIWDLSNFSCQVLAKVSEASIRSIAIHPSQQIFAIGSSDCHIRVYGTATLEALAQWKAHTNSIFSLSYDNTGSLLYSAGRDAHLKSWSCFNNYSLANDVIAHWFAINSVHVHPSSRWLVTGSMDKTIKIWNAQSLKLLKVLDKDRNNGHTSSVNKVVWLPNQAGLLSVSDDRRVLRWKLDWEGLESVS